MMKQRMNTGEDYKKVLSRIEVIKELDYYLNLPYRVEIVKISEEEGGGFMARLPQFGELGIVGDGDTVQEALRDLARNKKLRFANYLAEGQYIPEPRDL